VAPQYKERPPSWSNRESGLGLLLLLMEGFERVSISRQGSSLDSFLGRPVSLLERIRQDIPPLVVVERDDSISLGICVVAERASPFPPRKSEGSPSFLVPPRATSFVNYLFTGAEIEPSLPLLSPSKPGFRSELPLASERDALLLPSRAGLSTPLVTD